MAGASKRVLVCGATGYLGGYVIEAAKARGHWVRALVRDPARLGPREALCDEVFVGHATQPETLAGLCDDIDVVFSSLGNRTMKRKPDCWDVDYAANMNIVEWARATGVGHFVFVSVFAGAKIRASVPQIEARERVVDALGASEMPWTIIRPSGFFNDMSEILEMASRGTVWVLGTGEERFNPIHGADLAEVCVEPFGDPSSHGREFSAGGPEILSMREVAEAAFAALGTPAKIRSVPMWTLRATAKLIQPFNLNVASLLLMFGAFGEVDEVADCYGTHTVGAFFRERVEADALAVRG